MRIPLLLCAIVLWPALSLSQSNPQNTPHVISSGGDQVSDGSSSLDFTLGELAVSTIANGDQLTQGFHQGDLRNSTSIIIPALQGNIEVFPNPASSGLTIKTDTNNVGHLVIYNSAGDLVMRRDNIQNLQIDVSRLPIGTYTLGVITDQVLIAMTKVVIIH